MLSTAGSKTEKTFDYASLDAATSEFVREQTGEIRTLLKQTAENIVYTGQKLMAIKSKLQHGQFIDWLQSELGLHRNTANRFMHVAKEFGDLEMSHIVTFDLTALYQLATPSTPQAARDEAIALAKAGETITYALAKEIRQKYSKVSKPKAGGGLKPEKSDKPEDLSGLNIAPKPDIASTRSFSATSPSQKIITVISRGSVAIPEPVARTTVTILGQPKEEIGAERAGVWWQLDGKHLLFCGEPNSQEFQMRLPQQVPLLLAFPASSDWQPTIDAQNLIVMRKLPTNKKWEQLEEVLEAAILYWWKGDNLVVSCFVPSVKIMALFSRLSCRGVLAEPNEKYCRELIADWRKMGVKVQQLSSAL